MTEKEVTFNWAPAGGTATAPDDFGSSGSAVTIPPLSTSHSLTVTLVNDALGEQSEEFSVSLSDPVNVTLGASTEIQATCTILDDDNGPVFGSPIPDIYWSAQNTGSQTLALRDFFSDASYADEFLAFNVTTISGPGVNFSFAPETGELTVFLGGGDPGLTRIAIQAVNPSGATDDEILSIYNVAVTGVILERQLPDDTWEFVPDDEPLEEGAVLRWTAQFGPQPLPALEGIEWLATPAPATNYPDADWTVFAQSGDASPALGNLPVGSYEITPKVLFAGQFVMLALAQKKDVLPELPTWTNIEDFKTVTQKAKYDKAFASFGRTEYQLKDGKYTAAVREVGGTSRIAMKDSSMPMIMTIKSHNEGTIRTAANINRTITHEKVHLDKYRSIKTKIDAAAQALNDDLQARTDLTEAKKRALATEVVGDATKGLQKAIATFNSQRSVAEYVLQEGHVSHFAQKRITYRASDGTENEANTYEPDLFTG